MVLPVFPNLSDYGISPMPPSQEGPVETSQPDDFKQQALKQSLLAAGLSMLAHAKGSAAPGGFAAGLGQGGLAGMQTYQNAMANQLEMKRQAQQDELNTRYKNAQIHHLMSPGNDPNVTSDMKNFEQSPSGLGLKRSTPEYAKAFDAWLNKNQEEKHSGYAKGRFYSIFNLETGKTEKKSGDWLNAHPNSTIDSTDPDMVALKEHEKYAAGMSRFTNRLDTLGATIKNTMAKYGLNQGSMLQNYTVQDLIGKKILGSGDVVGLQNLINGYGNEMGKVESGSIGVAGATVEAMKQFKISPNMPASELLKVINIAQDAGKSVTDAMGKTKKDIYTKIYAGTNKELPKHIQQEFENQGKQVAPAGMKAKLKDGRIVTSDGKGGWN